MTESEALIIASAVLHEAGLQDEVTGLKSIRLSLAAEVREVLGSTDPDLADTWYVSFALKLDEGVVSQHPDNILITVDDHSGQATLIYQM